MNKFISCLILFSLLCSTHLVKGQASIKDSTIQIFLISANYSLEKPGGDLGERFGLSNFLGPAASLKNQNNWLFTLEHDFLFGNDVKENPLTNLETESGSIINGQGTKEPLVVNERGFRTEVKAGKIFPWFGPNPNSGPFFQIGLGLLQHKIHFKTRAGSIAQLQGEYEKGYDRLTNGLSITETLGYIHLSNSRLVNFSAAFQLTQAFTRNRRSFNFNTQESVDEQRLDLLFGVRVEWTFPIYKQASKGYYIQ